MALAFALTFPLVLVGWLSWSAAQQEMNFARRQLNAMAFMESTWDVIKTVAEAPGGVNTDPARLTDVARLFRAQVDKNATALALVPASGALADKLSEHGHTRGELLKDAYDLAGAISTAGSLGIAVDNDTSWTMWSLTWRLPQFMMASEGVRSAVLTAKTAADTPDLWRALAVFDDVGERTLFAASNIKSFRGETGARQIQMRSAALREAIARVHAKTQVFALVDPGAASRRAVARGDVVEAEMAAIRAAEALWQDIAIDANARLSTRMNTLSSHQGAGLLLAILVLSCAGGLAILFARSIVRPQRRLVRTMERLVQGDTAIAVPYLDYQNEVGDVAQAVEVFRQSLIARKDLETHLNREREALEERVAQRTRDLEEANAAKTRFVALLSHEIRTPLNGVLGMATALSRTPLDGAQREMLNLVTASGDVLLRLLNNAIDITRIEAGQFKLDVSEFDLADVVDFAASLYRETAIAKGVAFDVAIAPEAAGAYRGDIVRLRQIVQNLVSNAVKFTERGSVAVSVTRVSADGSKALLRLDVADTGIGLPAHPERLFTRFAQGDSASAQRFGGAGLGLAICRELAELMGGTVAAFARTGGGALFRLEIALESVAARPPTPLKVSTPTQEKRPHIRVLAADDNAMNRIVLKTLLSQAGIEVHLVEDGVQALETVRAAPFDVILMDVHMPGLDGLAASRLIRMSGGPNRETPIIALTADAMPDQIAACLDAGMSGHVAKPIQIETLFAMIEDALSGALAERAQTSQGVSAAS